MGHVTWLNIVKHIQGGQFSPSWPKKSVPGGPRSAWRQPFLAQNDDIWPLAVPASTNGLNIGWTWLNTVKHIQGGQFGPLGPQKVSPRSPRSAQKTTFFGSKMAIYGCFWHPPVALSRGLNGFNISLWMCPVMFNQLWVLFNPFWGIGGNHGKIHCFGRFSEPPGPQKGSQTQKKVGASVNHNN